MKVQSVSFLTYKNNINNSNQIKNSASLKYNSRPDIFVKTSAPVNTSKQQNSLSFMGYSVHILDGGNHATNMNHFAKSISNNKWDLYNKEVKTNYRDNNVKQLESLEWKLKELNFERTLSYDEYHKGAYVAIPVLATVPLQNLEAQMNAVMGTRISLTPQNILTHKDEVLNFLKLIYENPDKYRQYINYMDPLDQGIDKVYGIIYQINQINEKPDTSVYVPAGHPEYASIKWMCEQKNAKPELYNYISTGEDVNNTVKNIRQEIKDKGWYDFNLLTLSDAQVVNLKDVDNKSDYIYSAYDSCINKGGRGVYNFTPVRDENGNIKGYSYHDDKQVDYPYEEFPANYEIQNIAKFVGRPVSEVLADEKTTQDFKDAVWNNRSREPYEGKIYKVADIFPQNERDYNKMDLRGDYIDSSLQLFFRKNKNGLVIYPNCDCEGSGRPSVLSMWGSCFSIFNAIKKDIELKERFNERGYFDKEILNTKHPKEIKNLLKESSDLIANNKYNDARLVLQYAVELEKVAGLHGFRPLEALGDLYTSQGELLNAESCYNTALNELARQVLIKLREAGNSYNLADCQDFKNLFLELQKRNKKYQYDKYQYDNQSYIKKLFSIAPVKPDAAEPYRKFETIYNLAAEAERLYRKLAENCEMRNEDFPAFACNWAADRMQYPNKFSQEILERRANNNTYLGDYLHVD